MSHEYLIEQVQHNEYTVDLTKQQHSHRLTFNHPCKELMWVFQRNDNLHENDWFNFANAGAGEEKLGSDILTSAVLRLNGHYHSTLNVVLFSSVSGSHSFIILVFPTLIYTYTHLLYAQKNINHLALAISRVLIIPF